MKVVEIDRFAIGIDSGWRISARQGIQNSIFWYEWPGGECVNRPRPHVYAWGAGPNEGGGSYSFVNWEMLSVRPNRGMLTPSH